MAQKFNHEKEKGGKITRNRSTNKKWTGMPCWKTLFANGSA